MSKKESDTQIQELKTILVSEVPSKNCVEVSIRGSLLEVAEYSREIQMIYDLSKTYNQVVVSINSPGGSLMTCIDLIAALKSYDVCTTIAIGEAASAGFILWSIGDIRVVDKYTLLMSHRESYSMFGSKTREHLILAQVTNKVYERLYSDTADKLLTQEDIEQSKVTEVWIDGQYMIERGYAISMEDYNKPKRSVEVDSLFKVTDSTNDVEYTFIFDEDIDKFVLVSEINYVTVDDSLVVIDDINNFVFNSENLKQIPLPKDFTHSDD